MKSISTSVKMLLAKNMLASLILCFSIGNSLYSQNPAWSLAPKYRNGIGISSLPSTNDYTGQPAKYNSNMQLDAQGNILFFVVDYQVFNKSGEEIGALYSSTSSLFMQGNAEILIVPDPGNCQRYYIIASADDNSPALKTKFRTMLW